jgi:hypothetical protein
MSFNPGPNFQTDSTVQIVQRFRLSNQFLPPEAVEKIERMQQQFDDLSDANEGMRNGIEESRKVLSDRFLKKTSAEQEKVNRRFREEAQISIASATEKYNVAKTEFDRKSANLTSQVRISSSLLVVLERIDAYSKQLRTHVFLARPAKPGSNSPCQADLENLTVLINAKLDEIERAKDAPLPSAKAKELAIEQIDALAALGAPNVAPTIQRGKDFRFAETGAFGDTRSPEVNALWLTAWLHKDTMKKHICDLIDATANDDLALSDDQRSARIAALKSQLLALERKEEAMVEALQNVPRRLDADPRAVLGLDDNSPEFHERDA